MKVKTIFTLVEFSLKFVSTFYTNPDKLTFYYDYVPQDSTDLTLFCTRQKHYFDYPEPCELPYTSLVQITYCSVRCDCRMIVQVLTHRYKFYNLSRELIYILKKKDCYVYSVSDGFYAVLSKNACFFLDYKQPFEYQPYFYDGTKFATILHRENYPLLKYPISSVLLKTDEVVKEIRKLNYEVEPGNDRDSLEYKFSCGNALPIRDINMNSSKNNNDIQMSDSNDVFTYNNVLFLRQSTQVDLLRLRALTKSTCTMSVEERTKISDEAMVMEKNKSISPIEMERKKKVKKIEADTNKLLNIPEKKVTFIGMENIEFVNVPGINDNNTSVEAITVESDYKVKCEVNKEKKANKGLIDQSRTRERITNFQNKLNKSVFYKPNSVSNKTLLTQSETYNRNQEKEEIIEEKINIECTSIDDINEYSGIELRENVAMTLLMDYLDETPLEPNLEYETIGDDLYREVSQDGVNTSDEGSDNENEEMSTLCNENENEDNVVDENSITLYLKTRRIETNYQEGKSENQDCLIIHHDKEVDMNEIKTFVKCKCDVCIPLICNNCNKSIINYEIYRCYKVNCLECGNRNYLFLNNNEKKIHQCFECRENIYLDEDDFNYVTINSKY